MPLPPDLVAVFAPHVRARGDEYFRAGRVQVVASAPDRFRAIVLGSQPYMTGLERRRGGMVGMSCSCPYAEEGQPCKHMWATALAAAAAGHPLVGGGMLVDDDAIGGDDATDDDFLDDLAAGVPVRASRAPPPAPARVPRQAAPRWRQELGRLRDEQPWWLRGVVQIGAPHPPAKFPADRRIAYVIDEDGAAGGDGLAVELATQAARGRSGWTEPKRFAYSRAQWLAAPDPDDREIAQMLLGAGPAAWGSSPGVDAMRPEREFRLAPSAYATTLRRICATGRAFVRHAAPTGDAAHRPLRWDDGPPWRVEVALEEHGEHRVRVVAAVQRDGEGGPSRVPLDALRVVTPGLVVLDDDADGCVAARFDDAGAMPLVRALRAGRAIVAREREATALARELGALYPRLGPVAMPAAMGVEVVRVPPAPRLALRTVEGVAWGAPKLDAELSFAYEDAIVDAATPGAVIVRKEPPRVVARDLAAEAAALARLEALGARREYEYRRGGHVHRLPRAAADRAAMALVAEGWAVTIDDRPVRPAGATTIAVRSGVDWFDLEATVDFSGVPAALPALLAALRAGARTVTLGDGSLGLLPDEWVARHGALALAGAESAAGVRFGRTQVALLDALLAALPDAAADEAFARARARLREFAGFQPADAPAGFGATLRPYQREGLGWLLGLEALGMGGVLADDMGLGKTVQVLALLEHRRLAKAGASLVVVPASIVFNWVREAARFAPDLRVRVHHGARRRAGSDAAAGADLVLTTYGTLRRDAAEFHDVEWDYVILDEAQAIKNATTATAKAARLLRARHRLAVTGTPVENRLEELWSLFEFLGPGTLGAGAAFRRLAGDAAGRDVIARAVRPWILRRTKGQVAPELPERMEQTVWVELGATERKLYDELRDHYRAELLGRVARDGLAKSRMHVLEALLRLRQAACHPGLLDRAREDDAGAKLEVLLARVDEAAAEGHKSLVFSQFTTLLALVRRRLDARGLRYEYLDGRTRDRRTPVDRFQQDPAVPVFLVSLKAGGTGLNLTAAEYVFLLDPWWNPAVEAQAIDRAHRIGQARRVIATRLVARDTVEEKVLQLQEGKRALADAIVRADEGALRQLTREDLELLLG